MEFPDKSPMERSFIHSLRRMTSLKSEEYQDEFFRRIHVINDYLNEAGTFFNSLEVAASVMLTMDMEGIWGEEDRNR